MSPVSGARRVVLLGASAGGVEAISSVVSQFPADLPAAVLVVLHVPAWGTSVLPNILDRRGPLPAMHAVDGEPLVNGRIYVAPPDNHLVTEDGRARLLRSPKENGLRPAIDALFRSAANTYGPNVVAAVLSGALDDGTAGLVSVKAHGGVTVVQDPAEALFPSMPDSAVRFAHPDHVAPLKELAALVTRYVCEPGLTGNGTGATAATAAMAPVRAGEPAEEEGVPSELNCPECGGNLREQVHGDLLQFRCRVGHTYGPESLFSHQLESLEGVLWAAVVALQERGDLATRLACRMDGRGCLDQARRYGGEAQEARRRAEQVRGAIMHLTRYADVAAGR